MFSILCGKHKSFVGYLKCRNFLFLRTSILFVHKNIRGENAKKTNVKKEKKVTHETQVFFVVIDKRFYFKCLLTCEKLMSQLTTH